MLVRIPTIQYGYVEVEVENAYEAKKVTDEVNEAFGNTDFYAGGLNKPDFAKLRNKYMATGVWNDDMQIELDKCNWGQKTCMNQIKLGMKQDEIKDN